MLSTTCGSTSLPPRSCNVKRARPPGGDGQASFTSPPSLRAPFSQPHQPAGAHGRACGVPPTPCRRPGFPAGSGVRRHPVPRDGPYGLNQPLILASPSSSRPRRASRLNGTSVRRGKALLSGGCESHPTTVAPVGSSQGGSWRQRNGLKHLGRRAALGGSATMQAGTRVNAEQASKQSMWKPTLLKQGEGRRQAEKRATRASTCFHRGSGTGMHGR